MLIVQLLRKHGFDFLLNSAEKSTETIPARASFDSKGFRQMLYRSILATDMSLHFAWMQRLQNFGQKISAHSQEDKDSIREAEDADAAEERVLIAQALIKCADISNPVRLTQTLVYRCNC